MTDAPSLSLLRPFRPQNLTNGRFTCISSHLLEDQVLLARYEVLRYKGDHKNVDKIMVHNGYKIRSFLPVLNLFWCFCPPGLLMEYQISISIVDISPNLRNIDIDKAILKNIDIDKGIWQNIDINIDKAILKNIDINIDTAIDIDKDFEKIDII